MFNMMPLRSHDKIRYRPNWKNYKYIFFNISMALIFWISGSKYEV